MCDISGIDKVSLLQALWNNQQRASFFRMNGFQAPAFNKLEAESAIKGYIDYF